MLNNNTNNNNNVTNNSFHNVPKIVVKENKLD